MTDDAEQPDRDERVSLAGLDPEDALKALLKVDPDADPVDTEHEPPESAVTRAKKDPVHEERGE